VLRHRQIFLNKPLREYMHRHKPDLVTLSVDAAVSIAIRMRSSFGILLRVTLYLTAVSCSECSQLQDLWMLCIISARPTHSRKP